MDIFNSMSDIRAETAANRAENRASEVGQRLAALENRLNRLALVTHSLWELLKDRHGYTEDELRDWVTLTDLKDGQLDGRVSQTRPPEKCPKCARIVTRAFARCMYCGELASGGDAFDRVH